MNIHMALLLVVMAVTFFFYNSTDYHQPRKICITIVTVIMTCFSGFRTWWFGDLIKYYTLYRSCNGPDWVNAVFGDWNNLGIRLLFKGAGTLGISYDVIIFLIAALSAVTLGILVFRYSPAPYWSYLMYIAMGFYMFTYSGLKQTIAMAFLMPAAAAIFERKPKSFLFWTLLAILFHTPGAIFLAAYPSCRKKMDRYYFLLLLALMAAVFLFRDRIVGWFSEAYYEDESKYYAKKILGGRAVMMALFIIAGLILRPAQKGDAIYSQVVNLMIIATVIQTFSVYDNVFTRLADYYYQFVVLHMPMILESSAHQRSMGAPYPVRGYTTRSYRVAWVAITLFALWFYSGQLDSGIIQSYQFFWQIDAHAIYGA